MHPPRCFAVVAIVFGFAVPRAAQAQPVLPPEPVPESAPEPESAELVPTPPPSPTEADASTPEDPPPVEAYDDGPQEQIPPTNAGSPNLAPPWNEAPVPLEEGFPELKAPEFERKGLLIAASIGIETCGQPMCSFIPIGGIGRFEFGYRYKWIAPVVSLSIGGAPMDEPAEHVENIDASLRFFDVGAGVQVFPIAKGRIDPFVRLGIGYSRVSAVLKGDGGESYERLMRGGVQLGGGILFYVTQHLQVGPRFDAVLPFAGRYCQGATGVSAQSSCTKIADLLDRSQSGSDWNESAYDKLEERTLRRSLPKPWSLTFDLRVVF